MKNQISLTKIENGAVSGAMQNVGRARAALQAAESYAKEILVDIVAAHGLAPLGDGVQLNWSVKDGKSIIEWDDAADKPKAGGGGNGSARVLRAPRNLVTAAVEENAGAAEADQSVGSEG